MSNDEVENSPAKAERSSKKRFSGIALIVIAALAIVGVIILIMNLRGGDPEKTVFDADAFFLPENGESDTKYAIFRNNGERVTDFTFTMIGDFVDNYAYVCNEKHDCGIVDHNGKMSVEYGKYKYIHPYAGFYEVAESEENDAPKKLIIGNGDEVATDYKNLIHDYSSPFILVEKENEYALYSVKGNQLSTFEKDDDKISLSAYSMETMSIVTYKSGFVLLDNRKLGIAADHKTDKNYTIDSIAKDRSITILRSHEKDNDEYAIYQDEKVYEYGDKCKSMNLSTHDEERYFASCKDGDNYKLIRDGEVTDIVANSYDSAYRVYDEDHYAKYDSESKTVEFYVNNEKKSSAEASFAPTVSLKGYYLRNNKDSNVSLYSIDGEKLFTLDKTSYGDLSGLDENGNIVVRDPNQETDQKYYVVNAKGETISEKYSSVVNHGKYYLAKASDGKSLSLLDKDGQIIVAGDYKDFDFYIDDSVIFARTKKDEHKLIDVDTKAEKFTAKGTVGCEKAGFIRVTTEEGVVFYTLKGEKIHEYKK